MKLQDIIFAANYLNIIVIIYSGLAARLNFCRARKKHAPGTYFLVALYYYSMRQAYLGFLIKHQFLTSFSWYDIQSGILIKKASI